MELKDWVLRARKHKGWTQSELGDQLNVTKGNVSAWENGRHEPSYDQLKAIARLTGLALEDQDGAPSFWPFSDQLEEALRQVDEQTTHRIENMIRALLGLDPLPADDDLTGGAALVTFLHMPSVGADENSSPDVAGFLPGERIGKSALPSPKEEKEWHTKKIRDRETRVSMAPRMGAPVETRVGKIAAPKIRRRT